MRIYIVRHGKAVDADLGTGYASGRPGVETEPTDFDRILTPRGEAQAAYLGARVMTVDVLPQVIFASRYPRAIQTARMIQKSVGCPLQTEIGLEVDHSVREAIDLIEQAHHGGKKNVMLVGHNPQLGELIEVMASGLASHEMILKTGELVALDVRAHSLIGAAKIVGRLRLGADKNDESIAGGVFACTAKSIG